MHTWQLTDRVLTIKHRQLVMGIVNVTPDSFSNGGRYADPDAAVAKGLELIRQGADILDIGGESTRPGALPVPLEEELRRVVPVIQSLARQTAGPFSVHTPKTGGAPASFGACAPRIHGTQGATDDRPVAGVIYGCES